MNLTAESCSWCGRGEIGEGGIKGHSQDKRAGLAGVFCSDLCFSQCRRAAFKRAKVCDWCKHVRHTITYVDFDDGQRQLQFCTEKCLNQYKRHLFCSEAASLGIQSLQGQLAAPSTSTSLTIDPNSGRSRLLITPELWQTRYNPSSEPFCHLDRSKASPFYSDRGGEIENESCCENGALNLIIRDSSRSNSSAKRKCKLVTTATDETLMAKKEKHPQVVSEELENANSTSTMHRPSVRFSLNFPPNLQTWPPGALTPGATIKPSASDTNLELDATANLHNTSEADKVTGVESKTMATTASCEAKNHVVSNLSNLPSNFLLVPYPILIPLPIPIPFPIPIDIQEENPTKS